VRELNQRFPEWVDCKHSIELLHDYLEGTLPTDEKASLDLHFRACPPCLDFVRKYAATARLCKRALVEDEVPTGIRNRLTAFLKEHTQELEPVLDLPDGPSPQ